MFAQVLCTPKRAKVVTIVLAVMAAIMYNFALWTTTVTSFDDPYGGGATSYCHPVDRYFYIVMVLNHVDTIITLVIPTVLIIGGNIHIGYVLAKFYKRRTIVNDNFRLHCRGNTPTVAHASSSHSSDEKERFVSSFRSTSSVYANTSFNRAQMKVTRMLLIVSTTFLVLNIPSHTMRLILFYSKLVDPHYQPSDAFLATFPLTHFLYYANFCVTFLLYAASGRTFRKASKRLFHRIKHNVHGYCQKTRASLSTTRLADHATQQPTNQRQRATSRTNSQREANANRIEALRYN